MRAFSVALLGSAVLMGCGSSDDDSDKPTEPLPDEQLVATIRCSNVSIDQADKICSTNRGVAWGHLDENQVCYGAYCFEDHSPAPQSPGLTRFPEGHLIPVYMHKEVDPRFVRAMDRAEAIVGYPMFERHGVIELEIGNVFEIDYSGLPSDWGFIWSQGTTPPDCSSGTVSRYPNSISVTSYLANRNQGLVRNEPGIFTWINIDGDEQKAGEGCTVIASDDVTLHELGHALGMLNHFPGFGVGPAFDANAERVLRTMYHGQNPEGQPFDALYLPK